MRLAAYTLLVLALCGCQQTKKETVIPEETLPGGLAAPAWPAKLSDYNLFKGDLRRLDPAEGVYPYEINSPLFSDYAYKKRLIKLPAGERIQYHVDDVFVFPEGSVLIKNFYYPADFRKPESERQLLETRLLVLKDGLWEPLTYVWNDEQSEAFLEVAGRSMPISWIHDDGVLRKVDYSVPDLNQCRGCHLKGDKTMPIGPSARQLNHHDQLAQWKSNGLLEGLPESRIPLLASYENDQAPLADRARAWLEVNCAHCHRPDGQGKTSGLHLAANVTSTLEIGVGKPPVAAGKGSGGRRFSIVPGRPEESILLYRIVSTDPGVMMPEMGRKLVHEEGVELVRQWIQSMK